ncbi:MAG: NUDIX domain-containing protein [Candidatus Levybacteria bacterium]|nr:NUDIX domain-containing protein [Candidatus Levybacteria bacterium]
MHKAFYASGFLYRPQTQQILLQQLTKDTPNTSPIWSLIGGESQKEEQAERTFQKIIAKLLKVKLDVKSITAVYDYFHNEHKKIHFVLYGEVGERQPIRIPKGATFSWFTFQQTLKLPFSDQTKQDIIVAQRVINAKIRELENALINKG